MKRILCYTGTLGSGGIESATVSQFVNMDHSLLTFDFVVDENMPEYDNYRNIITKHGGKVIPLSDSVVGISQFEKISKLYSILKKGNYDAIHIHISYPSSLFYNAIAFFAGIKKRFATSHAQGTAINSRKFKFYQTICRLILPVFTTNRIAVSNVAGKWMYGKKKYMVLPNAIDTSRFKFNKTTRNAIRKELQLNDEILVGHVGRFAPDKNHEKIVKTFKELLKHNHNAKLLLIGDGPLHGQICELVTKLGIGDRVMYIKKTSEVYKYMHAMDVLLMPSLREACSVVIMEAQAASLPVLASDTIPLENKISNIFHYQSLDKSDEEWAQSLLTIATTSIDRHNVKLENGLFPCDIKELSELIQKLY